MTGDKQRETRCSVLSVQAHRGTSPFFRCGIADPLGVCDVKDQFGFPAEAFQP
jgi:hypothetical protein